jgi:hypothetical protein
MFLSRCSLSNLSKYQAVPSKEKKLLDHLNSLVTKKVTSILQGSSIVNKRANVHFCSSWFYHISPQDPPSAQGVSLFSNFPLYLLFMVFFVKHNDLSFGIVIPTFLSVLPPQLGCLLLRGPGHTLNILCYSLSF